MTSSDLAVRDAEIGAAAHAIRSEFYRYRIDGHWIPKPGGRRGEALFEAVLTVTIAGGHEMVFRAQCDPQQIAAALVALNPEVGGFSLGKMWKGIKKVAKTVATSKVFKLAGTALAAVAPALGPLAPALLAAGAGMKAATALVAAKSLAAKGNPAGAKKLVSYATQATKAAAIAAPPRGSALAASPSAAAFATHLQAIRSSADKLDALLRKPA